MRTNLKFWVDANNARWMRMTLRGDGWPTGLGVPYSYLASWGFLPYFKVPPADPEGLLAGQDYAMSDTLALQSFDAMLDLLHQLISALKPVTPGSSTFLVEDERGYT